MMTNRLPLAQALTAAGLERHGAGSVATAFRDVIEASVATKSDLGLLRSERKADIGLIEADLRTLRSEVAALEGRVVYRLGGIIVAGLGVLFARLRFTGHSP